MDRLGERIRRKREQLQLHLGELAEIIGISSSALSQIENSKSYPSIVTLKLISDSLHTSIGELMGENESLINQPVVLSEEISLISKTDSGREIFALSNHDNGKQMDALLIRLSGEANLDGVIVSKLGQIFCRVLSGALHVELNNKVYLLHVGDNLYFNARASVAAYGVGSETAELLWVQTLPGL